MVVLTRSEVLDVRTRATVAEITSTRRGIAAEVRLDHDNHDTVGLDGPSTVNGDGIHTVEQWRLTRRAGTADDRTMRAICARCAYAIGCDPFG